MLVQEEILTMAEVSKYLKVSVESLRTLIKKNLIPVARVGNQYRFRKSLVDLWLNLQSLDSFHQGLSQMDQNFSSKIIEWVDSISIDENIKETYKKVILSKIEKPKKEFKSFSQSEEDEFEEIM